MKKSLDMKNIFKCMMEDGYYPVFDKNHIEFELDDNLAVVEYTDDILSVRLFFSIESESYPLFLQAANDTMIKAYIVKPAVLDDRKNLMFSCEVFCDNVSEFRKFFPLCLSAIRDALSQHRSEMKKLIIAEEIAAKRIPATEDFVQVAGAAKSRKILS